MFGHPATQNFEDTPPGPIRGPRTSLPRTNAPGLLYYQKVFSYAKMQQTTIAQNQSNYFFFCSDQDELA